jgi:hypothetical protein
MLFFPEFLPEKNDPDKEKVNAAADRWMIFNGLPGLFHFPAPVYVIEDQDGIIIYFCQQLLKISFSGLSSVVTVNDDNV